MMVMMFVLMLFLEFLDSLLEGALVLDSENDLLAAEVVPVGRDKLRLCVVLFKKLYNGVELVVGDVLRVAEDDSACVLDLVVEELAEVLDVHLALVGVNDGRETVELELVGINPLNRGDNVGKLADA